MEQKAHYPHQAPIDFYGNGGFRFADMSHRGSLLCLPSGMWNWNVSEASQIDHQSLLPIFEQSEDIDVLFVGMGEEIVFFPADLRDMLREQKIIVEAVNTGSAVRT